MPAPASARSGGGRLGDSVWLGAQCRPAHREAVDSAGHPRAIFKRAIERDNVTMAEPTAREFALNLEEALRADPASLARTPVLTGSGSASVISPMFVPTPSHSRPLAAGLRGSGTCSVPSMPPVTPPGFESFHPLLPEALQIRASVVSGGVSVSGAAGTSDLARIRRDASVTHRSSRRPATRLACWRIREHALGRDPRRTESLANERSRDEDRRHRRDRTDRIEAHREAAPSGPRGIPCIAGFGRRHVYRRGTGRGARGCPGRRRRGECTQLG